MKTKWRVNEHVRVSSQIEFRVISPENNSKCPKMLLCIESCYIANPGDTDKNVVFINALQLIQYAYYFFYVINQKSLMLLKKLVFGTPGRRYCYYCLCLW